MSNNQEINFQGRVIDQEKQAPLSRIKVSLNFSGAPPVVYTDLEGIYKFKVNFRDSSIIKGQLTIEAKGYKTYNSHIELSPKHKDLGDIRLGTTHLTSDTIIINNSNSTPSSNSNNNNNKTTHSKNTTNDNNNMLMPLMVAFMIVFALIVAVSSQQPTQDKPIKTQNKNVNIYHKKHTNILNVP